MPTKRKRDPRTERTVERLMDVAREMATAYHRGLFEAYAGHAARIERALRRALAAERRRGT